MTTIIAMNTTDDRAIYCDSLFQHGSIAMRGGKKFFALPGMLVSGWCGLQNEARRVEVALEKLFDTPNLHSFFTKPGHADAIKMSEIGQRDFEMLILYDRKIWLMWEDMIPITLDAARHFSKGSGAHFALGALEAGASPWRALAIASQYDVGTGKPFFRCDMEGKITSCPSLLEG